MHIIIPPQPIIIGMPDDIMLIMFWQHCMNISFMASFIGSRVQVIAPAGVMAQVILPIIIGMAMPGIPPIMPIIGIMGFIIIGAIPDIIGIIGCIAGVIVRLHSWQKNFVNRPASGSIISSLGRQEPNESSAAFLH
jgi:hypothetical protein